MRIRDKIAALDAEEKKVNKQGRVKEAALAVIGVGLVLGGLLSIVAAPLATVSLCSLGAGVISGFRKHRNERVSKVAAIQSEKAQLRQLTQNGINVTQQSQQQRNTNIANLNKQSSDGTKGVAKASKGTGMRRGYLVGATLLGLIIPGPLSFVAIPFALYKLKKDNDHVKNYTKQVTADAKKDYLETENKIAQNIIARRNQRRQAAAQAVANARGNAQTNANTNTNQRTPVAASSPSKEMSENERIVDEYIRRLSEHPEETETASLTK